ncbi:hypothetical protein BLNAU_22193 [Blattamonas nauphoetae]|uniref:Uncharacterized protein n=1 Tax=Blattamonas nauphoetae TaxID=2049346 RepID=A0ABQ9WW07_9EUKA|nr:hypothetical protein BLNAU_22193 [Blattamonas nauphoetae]
MCLGTVGMILRSDWQTSTCHYQTPFLLDVESARMQEDVLKSVVMELHVVSEGFVLHITEGGWMNKECLLENVEVPHLFWRHSTKFVLSMDLISSLAQSHLETVKTILTTQQNLETKPVPECLEDTETDIPVHQVVPPSNPPLDPCDELMDGDEFEQAIGTPQRAFTFVQEGRLLPATAVCPECEKILRKTKKNRINSESRNDSISVMQTDCGIASEAA